MHSLCCQYSNNKMHLMPRYKAIVEIIQMECHINFENQRYTALRLMGRVFCTYILEKVMETVVYLVYSIISVSFLWSKFGDLPLLTITHYSHWFTVMPVLSFGTFFTDRSITVFCQSPRWLDKGYTSVCEVRGIQGIVFVAHIVCICMYTNV